MNRALPLLLAIALSGPALAQKVMLNPSNQTANMVSGGGNEAQYALDCANKAKPILDGAGFTARVDQDFYNSPSNANSWGAAIFVSMHTNAGGGHGIETLTTGSTGGSNLASKVLSGLLSKVPYQTRGVKVRTNLHVLNSTNMPATLSEAVFHDCTAGSGYAGHPPSESAFLRSAGGRDLIAAGTAAGVCSYFGRSCSAPPPPPPPPPPTKGFIKGVVYKNPDLNSHIAPATVRLNTGATTTYSGTTVWSLEVPAGTYTITASAAGYKPGSLSRTVTAGQTIYGSIGLDPEVVVTTGFLKGVVYKNPNLQDVIAGAKVTVTPGSSKVYDGTTDWSFELAAGTYTVTAEAPGYQTASITRTVTIGSTVTSNMGLDLIPIPEPDAGITPDPDAGTEPEPDAGTAPAPAPDPVNEPVPAAPAVIDPSAEAPALGGCGCATGGSLALPLAALLLAASTSRRKRRPASPRTE